MLLLWALPLELPEAQGLGAKGFLGFRGLRVYFVSGLVRGLEFGNLGLGV